MRAHVAACLLALALAAGGAVGCDPERQEEILIYATTGPPPARTATVKETDGQPVIQLSRGVVMGIRCWDSCDGECVTPTFTAQEPGLVQALPTYRAGRLSGHVLVGLKAGSTWLRVADTCAQRSYLVGVLDD
jgi:hypothetical protein